MPNSDGKTLKQITRLDNETLDIVVFEPDDVTPSNITNDTLKFEARYKVTDDLPVFVKSHASFEIVDAAVGHVRLTIGGADTGPMTKGATLKCQLVVTDAQGRDSTTMFDLPVRYRK